MLGWGLDLMIREVFSKLNDSMTLVQPSAHQGSWTHKSSSLTALGQGFCEGMNRLAVNI